MKVLARTLATAAVVIAAGCATKEVTLTIADSGIDAADRVDGSVEMARFPVPFCLSYVESTTGETCMNCYDEWGNQRSRVCKPAPAKCYTADDVSQLHCLYCEDAPGTPRACLKCEPAAAPGECAACQWSDTAASCRRCPDAAGALSNADCEALRPELPRP